METACGLTGISRKTLWEWLRNGKAQSHGPDREFFDRFQKALAEAEDRLVMLVRRIASGGVFTLPVYDEHGNRLVDEQGKPRVRRVTLPPNGRLGFKLLQLRNPREWGGKAEPVAALNRIQRPELPPDDMIKLFSEAFQILWNHGIGPPESRPNMSEVEPEARENMTAKLQCPAGSPGTGTRSIVGSESVAGPEPEGQSARNTHDMGRPSKLTPTSRQQILAAISAGQTEQTACGLARISRKTLWEWLQKGEGQSSGPYREFFDRFQESLATAQVPLVTGVWRTITGGVWEIPVRDEDGNLVVDKRGKPKVRVKIRRPDANLALRLLARRYPREGSGKADPDAAVGQPDLPKRPPGATIDLFGDAVQAFRDRGIPTPWDEPNTSKQRLTDGEDATSAEGRDAPTGVPGRA